MTPDSTALIALRVSTPEQLKNYSIPTQLQRCQTYAEQHGLWAPPDGIAIDDETGATLHRDDFSAILRRLRAGEAKHLIVFVLDRLTREPADFLPLRKELHARGVTIHIAREDRALSKDPLDDLPDDIRVVIAKHERAVFRERSMRGRAAKVASGIIPGHGPAPYGFRYEGQKRERRLVINEAEAEVIRLMARWFLFGDDGMPLSIVQITERLTALRIPTRADTEGRAKKRRGYGEWDIGLVTAILRDSTLGGIFYANRIERLSKTQVRLRPREQWIAIPVPPILDADTYHAIQRKIDAGRNLAKRNTRRPYLLRCRIRCACGRAICGWATSSAPARYYRCQTFDRIRYGERTCQLPYIRAELLEARVWHWIEHEALDDQQLQARIAREQAQQRAARAPESHAARRADLEAKLAANAAAEQQLLAEAIRKRFSEAAIDAEQRRIAAERDHLERQLAALGAPDPIIPLLSDAVGGDLRAYAAVIREGLADLTPDEQRHAIDMLDTRLILGIDHDSVVAAATCALRLDAARLLIAAQTRRR
jgi:site-specific DNA recombinase